MRKLRVYYYRVKIWIAIKLRKAPPPFFDYSGGIPEHPFTSSFEVNLGPAIEQEDEIRDLLSRQEFGEEA